MDNEKPDYFNCTCRDPLNPNTFLYKCGTDTCRLVKEFYEKYIEANRNNKK